METTGRKGRTRTRTILSLCDLSGQWSAPYEDAGYHVIRIDLGRSCPHERQDVRFLSHIDQPVYGILAAPPCTMLAASGARWRRTDEQMIDALSVVDACLRAVAIYRPQFWALENPVGKLVRYLGPPRLYFDPCEFAGRADVPADEAYTKRTGLWGQFNLPRYAPVEAVLGSKMHRLPQSENRAALRSVTPTGFARAFMEANL